MRRQSCLYQENFANDFIYQKTNFNMFLKNMASFFFEFLI